MMRSLIRFAPWAVAAFLLAPATAFGSGTPEERDAGAAFEELKALAGSWQGEASPRSSDQTFAVTQEIRVTANGTVVVQTFMPGTRYEELNVFHMAGGDLVLTHYCDTGTQPTMKLDKASSQPNHLSFDFTGGTSFDPAKDHHIHSGDIRVLESGAVRSTWTVYEEGEAADVLVFDLSRAEGE